MKSNNKISRSKGKNKVKRARTSRVKNNQSSWFTKLLANRTVVLVFIAVFGFIGYKMLVGTNAQNIVLYGDIDKYCTYHVMGSLYADGEGNGPPNGARWKEPNSHWIYDPAVKAQADRFQYCAELMAETNGATVERTDNRVELKNFSLNLPFNDLPKELTKTGDPRAYRAFLTSVVEGEGNSAGKIDDNFKCVNTSDCNSLWAHHVINLGTAVSRAGMGYYFVKGDGSGCSTGVVESSTIDLLKDNDPSNDPAQSGISICLNQTNLDYFASLPHAACTNRIPGGITKCSQLVADITAPTIPTNFMAVEVTSAAVKLSWNPSTDASGIKRYAIRRDGAYYGGVSGSQSSFVDKNVESGKTYYYKVRAIDNNGNKSDFSEMQVVTIPKL